MTPEALRSITDNLKQYRTAELNDQLYLHYKGWRKIENLEPYYNLKVLWLEGNALSQIEGLSHLSKLRTLYLQENCLASLDGLDGLTELDTLNVSQNMIGSIGGLSHMTKLSTLIISKNKLSTVEDVAHLAEVPSLSCVDLQKNSIDDPAVLEVLDKLKDLRVLYLMGNPVVKKIKNYRKHVIARYKTLTFLDDRPVFEEDRRRAEAFCKALEESDGDAKVAREAERAEMDKIRAEKKAKDEANFKAFDELVKSAKAKAEREKIEARQAEQGALYCRGKEVEDDEGLETSAEASARVYKKAMAFVTDGDEMFAGGEETKALESQEKKKKKIPCGIDPLTGDTLYKVVEESGGDGAAAGSSGGKFMDLLSGAMAEKAADEVKVVAKQEQDDDIFAEEAAQLQAENVTEQQQGALKDENGGSSFLAAAAGVDISSLD